MAQQELKNGQQFFRMLWKYFKLLKSKHHLKNDVYNVCNTKSDYLRVQVKPTAVYSKPALSIICSLYLELYFSILPFNTSSVAHLHNRENDNLLNQSKHRSPSGTMQFGILFPIVANHMLLRKPQAESIQGYTVSESEELIELWRLTAVHRPNWIVLSPYKATKESGLYNILR